MFGRGCSNWEKMFNDDNGWQQLKYAQLQATFVTDKKLSLLVLSADKSPRLCCCKKAFIDLYRTMCNAGFFSDTGCRGADMHV